MTRGRAISLVLALVLANLGYWAWRSWYAPPAPGSVPWRAPGAKDARPAPAVPGVASLRLAGEATAAPRPAAAAAVAATVAAGATVVAPTVVAPAPSPTACFEVGPFTALAGSALAAATLQQRGYEARLAYAAGVLPQRHVVRIDGLPTAADQARVLARLRAAGIADVATLPVERAVSIGVFSEASRAEVRARQARAAGFAPRIEAQYAADAEHWLRVDLVTPLPPGVTPARTLAGSWRVQPCAVQP